MSQLFVPLSQETTPSAARRLLSLFGSTSLTPLALQALQFRFTASTTQVSHLADVLSAITAIDRYGLMILSDTGIALYSEYNHIVNAQATIDASLFSTFNYDGSSPTAELGIDLSLLSDAFFATSTSAVPKLRNLAAGPSVAPQDPVVCYFKFDGYGSPLVVEFEDRLMSERIEFSTYELDIEYPYASNESQAGARGELGTLTIDYNELKLEMILQGDILTNLLSDLQHLNTEDLYLFADNLSVGNLVFFLSKGSIGYLKLIYPSAKLMLQKLEVFDHNDGNPLHTRDCVVSVLNFSLFFRIFKSARLSSKCKVMKDFLGVVSFQLLCKNTAVKNYPGTLITFNTLEKSAIGESVVPIDASIEGLFDDRTYHLMTETHTKKAIENSAEANQGAPKTNENFSYASFRITGDGSKRQRNGNLPEVTHDERDEPPEISIFF